MTTETEILREQIRELYQERQEEKQQQEIVAQAAPAAKEPLEIADLILWFAILFAVVASLLWFSVWALCRAIRAAVRGTSAAWHEGKEIKK